MLNRRQKAERAGRTGEALAALYLQAKRYRIVRRRYKSPVGEIDLIAIKAGTLIFIEVKQRRSGTARAEALAAVDPHRIARAASYFVARHPALAAYDMRFDVIFLAPFVLPLHLRNAFETKE